MNHSKTKTSAGFVAFLILTAGVPLGTDAAPLKVDPTNPRYFTDGTGKAVYVTGSHERNNFQTSETLPRLDFNNYLNMLQQHNHNFIRLWAWEDGRRAPLPYIRSGPGTTKDGKPKFDVKQFNQAYFDELRSRVVAARDRGIYVGVMLFQGWSIMNETYGPRYVAWDYHPFHKDNNINRINGDANGNGEGEEVHTLQIRAITDLQRAYVRKVIDTLNDLDNVIWEISNQSPSESRAWQYKTIDYIRKYESGKPKQHLVWMSAYYDPRDADLFNSPADVISPHVRGGIGNYRDNPPANNGSKIIINDTDHLDGRATDSGLVWKSLTRGLNPIFIDGRLNDLGWPPASYREAMGHARTYANKMNMATMVPRGDLASSGYALASPGREYLVYVPPRRRHSIPLMGSLFKSTVTVDLSGAPTTLKVEWFNPSTGESMSAGTTTGGDIKDFAAPFSGGAVLYLSTKSAASFLPLGSGLRLSLHTLERQAAF